MPSQATKLKTLDANWPLKSLANFEPWPTPWDRPETTDLFAEESMAGQDVWQQSWKYDVDEGLSGINNNNPTSILGVLTLQGSLLSLPPGFFFLSRPNVFSTTPLKKMLQIKSPSFANHFGSSFYSMNDICKMTEKFWILWAVANLSHTVQALNIRIST